MSDLAPQDKYEAQYMAGGSALYRARQAMPWWFFAAVGLGVVGELVAAIATLNPGPLIGLPILLGVLLLLSHLRVAVTATHVIVQFGLWGPKIALGDIKQVTSMPYKALRHGGWGIRYGMDGWVYSVPGRGGDCVQITYSDSGKDKIVTVTADDAVGFARAINEARAAASAGKVRVDVAKTSTEESSQVEVSEASKSERRGA